MEQARKFRASTCEMRCYIKRSTGWLTLLADRMDRPKHRSSPPKPTKMASSTADAKPTSRESEMGLWTPILLRLYICACVTALGAFSSHDLVATCTIDRYRYISPASCMSRFQQLLCRPCPPPLVFVCW